MIIAMYRLIRLILDSSSESSVPSNPVLAQVYGGI